MSTCHVPFHLELYWSILFSKTEHLSSVERSSRSSGRSVRLLPKDKIGAIHVNNSICIHLVQDDLAQSNLHDCCCCLPTTHFNQVKMGTWDPVERVWNLCRTANRIQAVTFDQIPMPLTIFLWYLLIRFFEFQSNSYSRKRPDPILESVGIGNDSRSSDMKKWSEFVVWDDTRFHDKIHQLMVWKLLKLYKNRGDSMHSYFLVSDNIDSIRIGYLWLSKIIGKLCS